MGLQDCQILLDNPWNTYYAGQTVNGQVKLTLNSPKKIRGKRHMNLYFITFFHFTYMSSVQCICVSVSVVYRN